MDEKRDAQPSKRSCYLNPCLEVEPTEAWNRGVLNRWAWRGEITNHFLSSTFFYSLVIVSCNRWRVGDIDATKWASNCYCSWSTNCALEILQRLAIALAKGVVSSCERVVAKVKRLTNVCRKVWLSSRAAISLNSAGNVVAVKDMTHEIWKIPVHSLITISCMEEKRFVDRVHIFQDLELANIACDCSACADVEPPIRVAVCNYFIWGSSFLLCLSWALWEKFFSPRFLGIWTDRRIRKFCFLPSMFWPALSLWAKTKCLQRRSHNY